MNKKGISTSTKKEGKIMSLIFKENVFDVFEMSSEVKM